MKSFVDAHCDTIVKLCDCGKSLKETAGMQLDLKRLEEYPGSVQFFAVWLNPVYYAFPMRQTMKYIAFYHRQMEENAESIRHVNSYADILQNKERGKHSAILSLEGGEALEGELSALEIYHRLGVRAVTLTWNHRNALADGAGENVTGGGLTRFGREALQEMERLGILADISHISDAGFWDVAGMAKKPFIASHSNVRALCPHPRNLTDDMLRAIASKGGVVGLNFYPVFLREDGKAGLDDVIRHASHMLKVMGEDHIGLGSDWDGIETTPEGLCHAGEASALFERMEREFGTEITEKIREKNFLRVLRECLAP